MARSSRIENEIWIPELLFCERDVYVIGGGPSLANYDLSTLKDESVIVVNSSYKAVLDAGIENAILYFTDTKWWNDHPQLLAEWLPRPIVTMSRTAKREAPMQIKRIQHAVPAAGFPDYGSPAVKWGASSGHTAVALAVAMGAKKVILLGFDMREVWGKSHHHTDYDSDAISPGVFKGWIDAFAGWNRAAKEIGVTIVNASEGSALDEFESVVPTRIPDGDVDMDVPAADPVPLNPITSQDVPVEPQRVYLKRSMAWLRQR